MTDEEKDKWIPIHKKHTWRVPECPLCLAEGAAQRRKETSEKTTKRGQT